MPGAVADVVAVEPAVLLRLSRQDFDAVAGKASPRGALDHPDLTFLAGRAPASPPRFV